MPMDVDAEGYEFEREAMISIDNGNTYYSADEADAAIKQLAENCGNISEEYAWEEIVNCMDDDIRESVHSALAPCTSAEFLAEYLRRADCDLIIG